MLKEALRLVRVYHDMTKADLARELGFSPSYVTELEAGKKKITVETLERYSSSFDIPMSSLMLFAERTHDEDFTDRTRAFIAKKTLKMLDWVSVISDAKSSRNK